MPMRSATDTTFSCFFNAISPPAMQGARLLWSKCSITIVECPWPIIPPDDHSGAIVEISSLLCRGVKKEKRRCKCCAYSDAEMGT